MKKKMKQIGLSSVLVLLAVVLVYNLSQSGNKPVEDNMAVTDESQAIKVEAIVPNNPEDLTESSDDIIVEMPKEVVEESPTHPKENVVTEVEPLVVPQKPEIKQQEDIPNHEVDQEENMSPEEDVVNEGDTEINPEPPTYETVTTVVETPNEPPKTEVNEDAKINTESEVDLVPDTENPFMQPPKVEEGNQAPGGHDSSEYTDDGKNEMGQGDKF